MDNKKKIDERPERVREGHEKLEKEWEEFIKTLNFDDTEFDDDEYEDDYDEDDVYESPRVNAGDALRIRGLDLSSIRFYDESGMLIESSNIQ